MTNWAYMFLVLYVFLAASSAFGGTYTMPLTLTGTYPEESGARSQTVDFGISFESIQSVSITWLGSIVGGTRGDGGPPPFPIITTPYDCGLLAWFTSDTGGIAQQAIGPVCGKDTYPSSESFSSTDAFTGSGSWSFLLDGRAQIFIRMNMVIFLDPQPRYRTYATGELSSATLILEGSPVPEPSGLVALLLGLTKATMLARKRLG